MKYILLLIFSFVIATHLKSQSGIFTISGTFHGDYKGFIYLKYENQENIKVKDSVLVENGKFYFYGRVNTYIPRASLRLSSTSLKCDEPNSVCFPLENSSIVISLTFQDFRHISIKGVETADTISKYLANQSKLEMKITGLEKKVVKTSKKKRQATLNKRIVEIRKSKVTQDITYIEQSPNSSLSSYLILLNEENFSSNQLNSLYYRLSTKQQTSYYGLKIREIVVRNERIAHQIGTKAPLFATKDINNKSLKLEDIYRNKIVLLDFWASWCIPCRQSHPKLKSLYEELKDKGFEIIGVASNMENEVKWREAVKKDSLIWLQILRTEDGLAVLNNPTDINEKYLVTTIPVKILIDRNGTIIGRYTLEQEDELEKILKKLFP